MADHSIMYTSFVTMNAPRLCINVRSDYNHDSLDRSHVITIFRAIQSSGPFHLAISLRCLPLLPLLPPLSLL